MKINNEQSVVEYLNHVRKRRKTNCPPSAEEIETLISYLKSNGLDLLLLEGQHPHSLGWRGEKNSTNNIHQ